MPAPVCKMCDKPGAPKPHLYPGPVRKWWYSPDRNEPHLNGFQEVDLHTPCVGSFMVLNAEQDLHVRLHPSEEV